MPNAAEAGERLEAGSWVLALAADLIFASRSRGAAAPGVPVRVVGNAEAVYRQATEHRPGLILLDLDHPAGSVPSLIERLKADPATAAVPLVGLGLAWLRPSVEFFDAPGTREEAVDVEAERARERDVVAEGVDGAGVPWTLAVRRGERGLVCVELDGGVACGMIPATSDEHWSASFGGSALVEEQRPRRCTAGAVVTDAERVRLDFDDGTTVELTPVPTVLDIPARFYGHCWQAATYVSATTVLDADGNVLDARDHDTDAFGDR
jgi:hypothetical protein